MYKAVLGGFCVVALGTATWAWQSAGSSQVQEALSPGVLIPKQTCAAQPNESYALYLPSHYIATRKWPIIYVFDPDGRGDLPAGLMKEAAERFGYIVVGSNNSRNGSWKLEAESAQAMWNDTHARFAIDERRIYFAGFSGGARVAAALAQQCKCAAGVLLSGAGFAGAPPSRDAVFPVFATVGVYDFNYPELTDLSEKLEQAGFPHMLRHFDGSHQWAPEQVMGEALAWFRLMAMKQNREAREDNFVQQQEKLAVARAQALESSGQTYEAWREYRQAAATFEGLTDTAALQQEAAALAQEKAVRDGAKREKQEFQEQAQLTNQIYAGLAALRGNTSGGRELQTLPGEQGEQAAASAATGALGNNAVNRADIFQDTEQHIVQLRGRTASERNQDRLRVDRRALAGAFIGAAEYGDASLSARDYRTASEYFQLASDANPESIEALQELGKAMALANDRKGSLKALRQAKEKSKDATMFTAWLNEEPAFAKLREDPEFRALLVNR